MKDEGKKIYVIFTHKKMFALTVILLEKRLMAELSIYDECDIMIYFYLQGYFWL